MNNPPAFPHVADILQFDGNSATVKTLTQNGMTLRDYFATHAMQALIDNDGLFSVIPTQAYALADAMLKAREA
jgi:hypothetical protein